MLESEGPAIAAPSVGTKRLSIALATYNGAAYLQTQLDSFLQQTRLPDELIAVDDASSDATVEILEAFKARAPFAVQILRNEVNRRHIASFERALRACTGDIIFFSDQDDAWFPPKLARIAEEFEAHPDAVAISNDAALTDETLRPTGETQLSKLQHAFVKETVLVYGCALAIRRELVPLLVPLPDAGHDTWICAFADAYGARRFVRTPLQYYRRHRQSTSNGLLSAPERLSLLKWVQVQRHTSREDAFQVEALLAGEVRRRSLAHRAEVDALFGAQRSADSIREVERNIAAISARQRLLRHGFVLRAWLALLFFCRGGYSHFSGLRSLVKDVIRR